MTSVRARGFTLVELAIAIFVMALILGSLLVPINTQVEQKQVNETEKTLEEIREALIGFALSKRYLPCPDTNNDGLEDVNAGSGRCLVTGGGLAYGNLPWLTLGLGNSDVWGNRYRYIMNDRYGRRAAGEIFTLGTPGSGTDIRVCTASSNCSGTALTTSAVAAVISFGRNGYGATNGLTGATNPAPASNDELENTDNDRDVVSRTHTQLGLAVGEFDDVVIWIPEYLLFNRMVAAGRLPQ